MKCGLLLGITILLTCLTSGWRSDSALAGLAIIQDKAPSVHILSIGISNYSGAPNLRTPTSDAQILVSTFLSMNERVSLKSKEIITDEQATRSRIILAYTALIAKASADDLSIFFFSGYATQDTTKSRIYLVPADFPAPSKSQRLDEFALDLQDIINATPYDKKVLIIIDGCYVGDGSLGPLMDRHPQLAVLASSKADELAYEPPALSSTPFVSSIVDILRNQNADLDGDGLLSVEELYVQMYPKMLAVGIGDYQRQHPSLIGLRSHRLMLAAAKIQEQSPILARLQLPDAVAQNENVLMNGKKLEADAQYQFADGKLIFLGSGADLIQAGLNVLTVGRQQFYLWRVGASFKAFKNPYQSSRAIIVAIDDYDRQYDHLKRGPTGFQGLTGMVDNAKKLKAALVELGFPEKGIVELYNENATQKKFEDVLESFWVGGENGETDRLFIYLVGTAKNFKRIICS